MLISSFDLEHHNVDLTQRKIDEEIQKIVCLHGIDEDTGDDKVHTSEDVDFGDEDNAVDMTCVPVKRKILGKILEFQDVMSGVMRIVCV